jgi:hypothetical protein
VDLVQGKLVKIVEHTLPFLRVLGDEFDCKRSMRNVQAVPHTHGLFGAPGGLNTKLGITLHQRLTQDTWLKQKVTRRMHVDSWTELRRKTP